MNKLILTLLAVGFMATSCYASQQDTYHVDDRGNVTKGAPKKIQSSIIISDMECGASSFKDMPKMNFMILR